VAARLATLDLSSCGGAGSGLVDGRWSEPAVLKRSCGGGDGSARRELWRDDRGTPSIRGAEVPRGCVPGSGGWVARGSASARRFAALAAAPPAQYGLATHRRTTTHSVRFALPPVTP